MLTSPSPSGLACLVAKPPRAPQPSLSPASIASTLWGLDALRGGHTPSPVDLPVLRGTRRRRPWHAPGSSAQLPFSPTGGGTREGMSGVFSDKGREQSAQLGECRACSLLLTHGCAAAPAWRCNKRSAPAGRGLCSGQFLPTHLSLRLAAVGLGMRQGRRLSYLSVPQAVARERADERMCGARASDDDASKP